MLKIQNGNTISGYQLSLLIMGFLFGSTAIFTPASSARQDAWLAYLVGWGGGFFLMWIYSKIATMYPRMSFLDILKTCFGKKGGVFITLLYVGYSIHLAAVVLRNFGEYMTITIYFETPIFFTIAIFGLVIAYSVRMGLRIFGRAAEMLMPYLFIFIILIFILIYKEYDLRTMLPVLDQGIKPVAKAAFGILTFPFGQAVAFLFIFPYYDKPKNLTRTALLSVGIMGIFMLSIVLRDLWALGPNMLTRVTYPPSMSTELIPGVTLDPIVAVNLLIAGWIKIAVCILVSAMGITQILNLTEYKLFALPVTAISVALSTLIFRNIFELLTWWKSPSKTIVVIFFQIFIPFIIIGITILKNRKKKKGKA